MISSLLKNPPPPKCQTVPASNAGASSQGGDCVKHVVCKHDVEGEWRCVNDSYYVCQSVVVFKPGEDMCVCMEQRLVFKLES